MDKLMKQFGPDGFHYLVPISPDTELYIDEDWYEE